MNSPLISIIIPVYNIEQYLERCVNSVINQTYTNLEIILVDDGSTDSSGEICDKFANIDNRIKVYHLKNSGVSAARNYGIKKANGEYIGFIDSDDWIAKDMYECLCNNILLHNADFSCIKFKITTNTDTAIINENEETRLINQEEMLKLFFRVYSDDLFYCIWDKLYKTNIIKNIQFLDGKRFEDIDFMYRVIKESKKAVISNNIGYFWFFNTQGFTNSGLKSSEIELFDIWKNIVDDCKINFPNFIQYAKFNQLRANFVLIGKALKYGVREDFVDFEKIRKKITDELRQNCFTLLSGNMSLIRKIQLLIYCVMPNFTFKLAKLINGVK